MGNLQKLYRRAAIVRPVARVLRTLGFKKTAWNLLIRCGVTYGGPAPMLAAYLSNFAKGGLVVEHGCGIGTLPAMLQAGSFGRYIGYDISPEAIQIACRNALPNCSFRAGAIEEWQGDDGASLVVAKEVAYYLTESALREFIKTAHRSLRPGGRLVVTIHDPEKHAKTVDVCQSCGMKFEANGILGFIKT